LGSVNKKYILLIITVVAVTGISHAAGGPPPPPSEKLPLGNLGYLAVAGLYYGYKKMNR
jgi:hypothetical protein